MTARDACAKDPQRILIIKPSAIGDVVHTLPILNLVRRRWPRAQIAWLVTPACAGLLQGHPQLDEVILFERKRLGAMWKKPWMLLELRRFTRSLQERNFDLVLDLQGLFRSGWLSWRTGAKHRVGFANAREAGWIFYNDRVAIATAEQHAIDRYRALARHIGCDDAPVEFVFATDQQDRAAVREMLLQAQANLQASSPAGVARAARSESPDIAPPQWPAPYAVLLPATNWATKRWPVEKFAALVQPLKARFGLETVVAGGPDAAELAANIPGATSLAGRTTLRQLTALLEGADLVIANDSGPMHIAAALGRPLVTVFGPTNPVRTGPYGRSDSVVRFDIECSPCYRRSCSHHSCMRNLEIEPVLAAARRQMKKSP